MVERQFRVEREQPRDLRLRCFSMSEEWGILPEYNQDAFYVDPDLGIAIVADGKKSVGIAAKASLVAVRSLAISLINLQTADVDDAMAAMRHAMRIAHVQTKQDAAGNKTSVTAMKVIDTQDGRTAVIGSVGKTRAYLLRDRTLELVTRDHGVGIKQMDKGANIEDIMTDAMDAVETEDDLRAFRKRKFGSFSGKYVWDQRGRISFAVGGTLPENLAVYEVPLQAKDQIILVSEGMQNLSRAELEDLLNQKTVNPAKTIVEKAMHVSANKMNIRSIPTDITAIVVEADPRNRRIKEHKIKRGHEVAFDYTGQVCIVILPDGNTLRLGRPTDVRFTDIGNGNFVLVNDQEYDISGHESGAYWIPDESYLFVGKTERSAYWQVHKGGNTSHMKISRNGNQLRFQDLYTEDGFTVLQPLRD